MKQVTIGNVELTTDGERLTLCYTRQFARRTAFNLLLGLFLLILGGVIAWVAVRCARRVSAFCSRQWLAPIKISIFQANISLPNPS